MSSFDTVRSQAVDLLQYGAAARRPAANAGSAVFTAEHRLANYYLLSTHTHTHPFNGPLSETTRVSRYQIGETNLDFTEARDSEWQWHQLGRMQVCTSLQTDDHASTPPLSFFTGRMPFLPPNQQCQSTEGDYCPPYDLFTTQSVVTNSGQNTTVLQRREAHKDA